MNLSLDEDNNLPVIDGNLKTKTGIEEISQMLETRFKSFQGDWFLDLDQGMPYYQEIFLKSTTVTEIESIFLQVVAGTPGVLDIREFNLSLEPSTRTLTIEFTVLTTDGVLDFSTEVTQ